ncbi:MAG: beta-ketoacyl-[acyl-carrier-protein] synthase family protein [Candidatus Omnitrophica bacterium]|nr:beta-ketoacyl-[acyl-carrier-protein] synthase family protein [Candidatus Omnitrophota bacterium]
MSTRVVITGIGVVASIGVGRRSFFEALAIGKNGIKPISVFDASGLEVGVAGEVSNFDPRTFLGQKGLRTLDRSTTLLASAAYLALDDAKVCIDENNTHDVGVSIGCTLGSLASICDFDKVALTEGPQFVNPAFFPNTVFNSPASEVSIKFAIKGFNATLATGMCASLDAIKYGWDSIVSGRARMVLAGGVEELCLPTLLGFLKSGCLAKADADKQALFCPFDKRRSGSMLGEGSCVLLLEALPSALARKATIYGELRGYGRASHDSSLEDNGLAQAMERALQHAGLQADGIDYVCASANASVTQDALEAQAINKLFGATTHVSAVKSMFGECFSADGALQTAAALGAFESQLIPPTINYAQPDAQCDLALVANTAKPCAVDKAMINTFDVFGNNASLVIARFTT